MAEREKQAEKVSIQFLAEAGDAEAARECMRRRKGRPMTTEQLRDFLDAMLAVRDAEKHRLRAVEQTGLLSRAVHLPGCTLATITIAARIKLRQAQTWPIPAAWRDNCAEWSTLVNAWFLASCDDRNAIDAVSADTLQPLVEAFAEGVHCDFATLAAETVSLLTYGRPPEALKNRRLFEPEHPDNAGMIVQLCSQIGGTPDYWLYQAPESQVAWLCRSLREQSHARYAEGNPDRMDPDHPKVGARMHWDKLTDQLTTEPVAQEGHSRPGSSGPGSNGGQE